MIYTLVVSSAPYSASSSTSHNALLFAKAVLAEGHSIYRLFFYGEGVFNLSSHSVAPQGEYDLCAAWDELIKQEQLDSVVCIAAAVRRGILDATESERHHKPSSTLKRGSELSGLGQLIEAAKYSDRLITFG